MGSRIMTRIKWREVFKFLSYGVGRNGGQLLLVPLAISVPFLGYTISPKLLGARAALQFVLFSVFFYFGYLKKWSASPCFSASCFLYVSAVLLTIILRIFVPAS